MKTNEIVIHVHDQASLFASDDPEDQPKQDIQKVEGEIEKRYRVEVAVADLADGSKQFDSDIATEVVAIFEEGILVKTPFVFLNKPEKANAQGEVAYRKGKPQSQSYVLIEEHPGVNLVGEARKRIHIDTLCHRRNDGKNQ